MWKSGDDRQSDLGDKALKKREKKEKKRKKETNISIFRIIIISAAALLSYAMFPVPACKQARREPQRGPGKHYPGTLSPHSACLEIETPKASRGRKRGEGCPLTIRLEVRGRFLSSPAGSGRKWILCILSVRKKPSWTPFPVFLSDSRAHQTSRGQGKLSTLFPLSTGLCAGSNLGGLAPAPSFKGDKFFVPIFNGGKCLC